MRALAAVSEANVLFWERDEYRIEVDCRPQGPAVCQGAVTIQRGGSTIRDEHHLCPLPSGGPTAAEERLLRKTLAWFFTGEMI
jgi:hypothetical protein